jgi:hypothetical protein
VSFTRDTSHTVLNQILSLLWPQESKAGRYQGMDRSGSSASHKHRGPDPAQSAGALLPLPDRKPRSDLVSALAGAPVSQNAEPCQCGLEADRNSPAIGASHQPGTQRGKGSGGARTLSVSDARNIVDSAPAIWHLILCMLSLSWMRIMPHPSLTGCNLGFRIWVHISGVIVKHVSRSHVKHVKA